MVTYRRPGYLPRRSMEDIYKEYRRPNVKDTEYKHNKEERPSPGFRRKDESAYANPMVRNRATEAYHEYTNRLEQKKKARKLVELEKQAKDTEIRLQKVERGHSAEVRSPEAENKKFEKKAWERMSGFNGPEHPIDETKKAIENLEHRTDVSPAEKRELKKHFEKELDALNKVKEKIEKGEIHKNE